MEEEYWSVQSPAVPLLHREEPMPVARLSGVAPMLNLSSSSTASGALGTRRPVAQRSWVPCERYWSPGGAILGLP